MKRITLLRNEKDISRKELASELQVTTLSIGRYESGERQPDFQTLIKIAKFFDVSTDYLLEMTPFQNPYYPIEFSNEEQQLVQLYRKLSDEDKIKIAEIMKTFDKFATPVQSKEGSA